MNSQSPPNMISGKAIQEAHYLLRTSAINAMVCVSVRVRAWGFKNTE
jgi:hypothetical protein